MTRKFLSLLVIAVMTACIPFGAYSNDAEDLVSGSQKVYSFDFTDAVAGKYADGLTPYDSNGSTLKVQVLSGSPVKTDVVSTAYYQKQTVYSGKHRISPGDVSYDTVSNLITEKPFTYSTWLYFDGCALGRDFALLSTSANGSSRTIFPGIYFTGNTSGQISLNTYTYNPAEGSTETGYNSWFTANNAFALKKWNNIAVSYDPTNPTEAPKLYINGTLTTLRSQGNNRTQCSEITPCATDVRIGVAAYWTGSSNAIAGYPNDKSSFNDIEFYDGILTDDEVEKLYTDKADFYKYAYEFSAYNGEKSILALNEFQSLIENNVKFEINFDDNTDLSTVFEENIFIADADGNKIKDFTFGFDTENNRKLILNNEFVEAGAYKFVIKTGILDSAGENLRDTDYILDFNVLENSELRDFVIAKVNTVMQSGNSDEYIMDEILKINNYLKLDVSETSEYNSIINKSAIFGKMAKSVPYASIEDIRLKFNEAVASQVGDDIKQAVVDFSVAVSAKNLEEMKDLLFSKYKNVFMLDTEVYDTLTDKDAVLKRFFDNSYSEVSEIKTAFAKFVDEETVEEKKKKLLDEINGGNLSLSLIENYNDILEFDITSTDYINNAAEAAEELKNKTFSNLSEFSEKFISTVVLKAFNNIEAGRRDEIKRIIEAYPNYIKTSSKYANYSDKNSVYVKLSGKKFNSLDELVVQIDKIIDTLKENKNLSKSSSGGSGGSGSFSGSKDIVSEPIPPKNTKKKASDIFDDTKGYDWADEAIVNLYEKNIISGKSEKAFAPSDSITRGETAKIISLAFEITGETDMKFSDVADNAWQKEYIASLVANNVAVGYEDGTFGVDKNITREEACVILQRICNKKNISLKKDENSSAFSDDSDISDYAKDAVYLMKDAGIIDGMGDGAFAPKDFLTRAQLVKIVNELMKLTNK